MEGFHFCILCSYFSHVILETRSQMDGQLTDTSVKDATETSASTVCLCLLTHWKRCRDDIPEWCSPGRGWMKSALGFSDENIPKVYSIDNRASLEICDIYSTT